jgi:hypothetical protein
MTADEAKRATNLAALEIAREKIQEAITGGRYRTDWYAPTDALELSKSLSLPAQKVPTFHKRGISDWGC